MSNVQLYKSRVFVFTWHLIVFAQFAYAMYYDYYFVKVPPNLKLKMVQPGTGGRARFLTYWCLILQVIYYTVALLNDFFGTNEVLPRKNLPLIRRTKDFLFASLALPVSLNVGSTFWALMSIDRELVFPKALDVFYPNWLSHVMHTNIVIFIILELFTSFRQYPSRKAGITALSLFMASYLVWLHVIKYLTGHWLYPVLDVMPLPLRIVFFILIMFATSLFYFAGEYLNSMVWTKEIKLMKQNKKIQ